MSSKKKMTNSNCKMQNCGAQMMYFVVCSKLISTLTLPRKSELRTPTTPHD